MRTARSLLVCAGMLVPALAVAQDAKAFEEAYHKRDWNQDVQVGERWALREPESQTAAYNLACAYALAG